MPATHAVLLRAIAHVPMAPFRAAMAEMGFADVASVGMSGNLAFSEGNSGVVPAGRLTAAARDALETVIGQRFGTDAFVRTAAEVAAMLDDDPFAGRTGNTITALSRAPSPDALSRLEEATFGAPRPVVIGTTLYFTYPAPLAGRRTHADFEALLGVRATARSRPVVEQLAAKMG